MTESNDFTTRTKINTVQLVLWTVATGAFLFIKETPTLVGDYL